MAEDKKHGLAKIAARLEVILFLLSLLFAVKFIWAFVGDHDFTAAIPIDSKGNNIGRDFAAFWEAARFALAGQAQKTYELVSFSEYLQNKYPHEGVLVWVYSPAYLLLITPLGIVSYLQGLVLFCVLSALVLAYACKGAVKDYGMPAVLLSPAALYCFMFGQTGIIFAGLLVLAFRLMDNKKYLCGFILGVLAISKPQLCILLPVFLLVKKEYRVIGFAVLAFMMLVLTSVIVFGAESWLQYMQALNIYKSVLVPILGQPSLMNAVRQICGDSFYILYGLVSVAAIYMAVRVWINSVSRPVQLLALVLAVFIISPYYLVYDMVLLLAAYIWLMQTRSGNGYIIGALMLWLLPLVMVAAAGGAVKPVVLVLSMLTALLYNLALLFKDEAAKKRSAI